MNPIKEALRSRVTHMTLAIAAFYWTLMLVVDPLDVREVLDSMLIALCLVGLPIYGPTALRTLRKDRLDRQDRLVVSIVLGLFALLFIRGLAVYGRAFGRVSIIVDSPLFGFFIWAACWSVILVIMAPGADGADRDNNQTYGRWIVIASAIGGLLAGFFLGVRWGWWFGDFHNPPPMTG